VGFVRDVASHGDSSGLLGDGFEGLGPASGCDHGCAFGNEAPDDRGADPSTATGHESDLARQTHSVYCIQVPGR
jgi:hypothetical protein